MAEKSGRYGGSDIRLGRNNMKKKKIKKSEGLDVNIDNLSMSHIVQYNPIVYASEEIKK